MRPMLRGAACAAALLLSCTLRAAAEPAVLDDFRDVSAWTAHPATGVELAIVPDGGAMRLDFDFRKGGGYAVARRALDVELPANYRFTFRIRGNAPANDLEFKLLAPGLEDVWWRNQRAFEFPAEWREVVIRKRHVTFAWGPSGGGEMKQVAALEFAITAGTGGRGSVWIDDLAIEALPEPGVPAQPLATATSSARGGVAPLALDGDPQTAWRPGSGNRAPQWTMDLGSERAFGGLVLTWLAGRHALDYDVDLSFDGDAWRTVRAVRGSDGGTDPILLSDSDARYVRVSVLRAASGSGVALAEAELQPLEWGASRETFFRALAADAKRGTYPRAYSGQQSYWTVIGLDAAPHEAMIDEDGRIEAGKGEFSIEPFVVRAGKVESWADAEHQQGLEGGSLPLPWVRRRMEGLDLTIRTYPTGTPGAGRLIARYTLAGTGAAETRGTLYLAARPFQVNPPQQNLNTLGGTARIHTLVRRGRALHVNGPARIVSVTAPAAFGAATFDAGGILPAIEAGRLRDPGRVEDPFEHASAAFAYVFRLAPGDSVTVDLRLALGEAAAFAPGEGLEPVEAERDAAVADWRRRLAGTVIDLPDAEVARTVNAQIGWILVNRDGAAIQPGSRAYERSWIRDGSLTSTALLRTGHHEAVRAFIEWFAPYLYDDGKVPCCVDHRGSDPVPEHDSSGEWIYLVAEYVRHTGDLELARRMWPGVAGAVAYLDSLRQTRRTPEFETGDQAHFYGLLPPSISHEGYSAKPMHSYWDDLFALRGFHDAVYLARALGREADAAYLQGIHDSFAHDLGVSVKRAMQVHGIDYVPGAADLGDFDATSTTIALTPGEAGDVLPRAALERTFERYWEDFIARRDGSKAWQDMTPYETRTIGSFVRLGWRARANELLEWFMTLRRPPGWAHWAEVVHIDPRHARFLGDMPHTWVGSDFVRSVLDMIAYESERDSAIVIGAGVPWAWVAGGAGVRVEDLSTAHGMLDVSLRASGEGYEVQIGGDVRVPAGGFVIAPFEGRGFGSAELNGRPSGLEADGSLVVRSVPATVRIGP